VELVVEALEVIVLLDGLGRLLLAVGDGTVPFFWYRFMRFGPPQYSLALAAHGMVQPLSVTGVDPGASPFPQ
jgi:hypothetical protein